MVELKGSEVVLTFLGTGSAIPPLKRQQSSFALTHHTGTILFDCGEGTQYQIRRNKVSTNKNFILCISHMHSDHTLGIPGLLSSFQLQGRTEPMTIIGPAGIADYTKYIMYAFNVKNEYPIKFIELYPGDNYKGKNFVLKCMRSAHDAPGGALSYIWIENDFPDKFDTDKLDQLNIPRGPHLKKLQRGETIFINDMQVKPEDVMFKGRRGRVIAYSGDTMPNKDFIKRLPDITDVLVHEGSFPDDMEQLARERGHSTFSQVARVASLAKINQLILTHISPRFTYKQLKNDLKSIQKIIKNTRVANDNDKIIIELPEVHKNNI